MNIAYVIKRLKSSSRHQRGLEIAELKEEDMPMV